MGIARRAALARPPADLSCREFVRLGRAVFAVHRFGFPSVRVRSKTQRDDIRTPWTGSKTPRTDIRELVSNGVAKADAWRKRAKTTTSE